VLLGKLSRINRPLEISFGDMLKLMQQCNQVDKQRDLIKRKGPSYSALYERNSDLKEEHDENMQGDEPSEENENRGILAGNPFSFFQGVVPNTKWCGTGDIAKNFHDLGIVSTFLF
jgi:secretory phospholipase A2